MTTSYPAALDSFTNPTATDELDDEIGTRTHSEFHADVNDAIEAIEAELGIDPSGGEATVKARIAAAEASVTAEAVLARNADNLTSGTVADARIASTIARDSEVTAAVDARLSASNATDLTDGGNTTLHTHDIYAPATGQYPVNTVAASGSTETLPATHSAHRVTMDQACTFTFSAPTAGHTFLLWLSGAFTPTFPASVEWDSGLPPVYTTPALYAFTTLDAGTTWAGSLISKAMA